VGDGIQKAGDDMSRPYVVKTQPSARWYFGAGDAGLTSVTSLQSTTATDPYGLTVMSPDAQKCHWVYPAAWGTIGVTLSNLPLELMEHRAVTIDGIAYTWVESAHLGTWTDARFVVGAP
jgi:hypothetical protein